MKENQNNVDRAIQLVRQLQAKLFDRKTSPDDIFQFTNQILEVMELARKEINVNYAKISAQLTERLNTGRDPEGV